MQQHLFFPPKQWFLLHCRNECDLSSPTQPTAEALAVPAGSAGCYVIIQATPVFTATIRV
jgi:hypothetical protein